MVTKTVTIIETACYFHTICHDKSIAKRSPSQTILLEKMATFVSFMSDCENNYGLFKSEITANEDFERYSKRKCSILADKGVLF